MVDLPCDQVHLPESTVINQSFQVDGLAPKVRRRDKGPSLWPCGKVARRCETAEQLLSMRMQMVMNDVWSWLVRYLLRLNDMKSDGATAGFPAVPNQLVLAC